MMTTWNVGATLVLTLLQIWAIGVVESSGGEFKAASPNVGINYGRVGNDLPSIEDVVKLVQSLGIQHVKIYDYDAQVIQAFANTSIALTICVPNAKVATLAADADAAKTWVHNNVKAHYPAAIITAIAVGNEINSEPALVPAMQHIYSALQAFNLQDAIKISTPLAMNALSTSYPPSAGAFANASQMLPLLQFLNATNSSYMMDIYPYFVLLNDPVNVDAAYALFQDNAGDADPNTGLQYSNLFDAMFDANVYAMKSLGFDDIPVIVTETGWPSKGDSAVDSFENAQTYNNNLVKHLISTAGTPARPAQAIRGYIFALFNENQKPGPLSERNFGLIYPNQTKVYDMVYA